MLSLKPGPATFGGGGGNENERSPLELNDSVEIASGNGARRSGESVRTIGCAFVWMGAASGAFGGATDIDRGLTRGGGGMYGGAIIGGCAEWAMVARRNGLESEIPRGERDIDREREVLLGPSSDGGGGGGAICRGA